MRGYFEFNSYSPVFFFWGEPKIKVKKIKKAKLNICVHVNSDRKNNTCDVKCSENEIFFIFKKNLLEKSFHYFACITVNMRHS